MTYSIVGFDAETRGLGVAVASHSVAVGNRVPYVRAGVGAVATQALTEPTYGPRAIEGLLAGRDPGEVLHTLASADAAAEHRQVAVIDEGGRWAGVSGARCLPHAAQQVARHVSAQGNLLTGDEVVPAIIDAFDAARKPSRDADHESVATLAHRLLDSLVAGERAGGDLRGARSAALVVALPAGDRLDVRVDDAHRPLDELRALLGRAIDQQQVADAQRAALLGASAREARALAAALARIPGSTQRRERNLWRAVLLARGGDVDECRRLISSFVEAPWLELIDHLVDHSLLPATVQENLR